MKVFLVCISYIGMEINVFLYKWYWYFYWIIKQFDFILNRYYQ